MIKASITRERNIRRAILASFLCAWISVSHSEELSKYGHFEGEVDIQLLRDGRRARLLQPFVFVDPDGKVWTAPKDLITDGASIPRALWSIIGSPWTGLYRNGAVIHDEYCDTHAAPWQVVHKVFYNAMLANGVSELQAKIMYAAVYRFGPRWQFTYTAKKCDDCASVPYKVAKFTPSVDKASMRELKTEIEAKDPPLEDIEKESDAAVTQELITRKVGTPLLLQ